VRERSKRALAWVLAFGMVFGLSACGGKEERETITQRSTTEASAEATFEEILAAVQENAKNAKSIAMRMRLTAYGAISVGGQREELEFSQQNDMLLIKGNPEMVHSQVDFSFSYPGMGVSQDVTMDSYYSIANGKYESHVEVSGQWVYGTGPESEYRDLAMDIPGILTSDAEWRLAAKTEKVAGTECYVLTARITDDSLHLLSSFISGLNLSASGEEFKTNDITLPVYLYVEKETLMPYQIKIDGANKLNSVFEGTALEGSQFTEFAICIDQIAYDTKMEITIPAEALQAKSSESLTTGETSAEESTGQFTETGTPVSSGSDYVGNWVLTTVEMDGWTFTLDELAAITGEDMSEIETEMEVRADGTGRMTADGETVELTWAEIPGGFVMSADGEDLEFQYEDGCLVAREDAADATSMKVIFTRK